MRWALHRLHRIGQHQRPESARQRILEHGEDVGIHEGFAAGEADLLRRQAGLRDLVEKGEHLGAA